MSGLRQREPRYQNRKLLDVAHDAPCMLQLGAPGCGNHPSVPCHSDMLEHGRGVGNKSHDALCVAGCPDCHAKFTRKHLGDDYEQVWARAYARYQVWLWTNNKIKVAA